MKQLTETSRQKKRNGGAGLRLEAMLASSDTVVERYLAFVTGKVIRFDAPKSVGVAVGELTLCFTLTVCGTFSQSYD
jgi:hypothetical protein